MSRKFVFGFLLWIILFHAVSNLLKADISDQVRVKVRSADILLKPSIDATVIGRAGRGQVLDVIFRIGPWVKVNLMSDPDGNSIVGYIGQHHIEAIPFYYVRYGFSRRKTLGSEWTETFGIANGNALGSPNTGSG